MLSPHIVIYIHWRYTHRHTTHRHMIMQMFAKANMNSTSSEVTTYWPHSAFCNGLVETASLCYEPYIFVNTAQGIPVSN